MNWQFCDHAQHRRCSAGFADPSWPEFPFLQTAGINLSKLQTPADQADLIGLPVRTATQAEVTVWGVVRLAGEMIQFWDKKMNQNKLRAYRLYKPRVTVAVRQKMRAGWKKNIQFLLSTPR